MKFDPIVLEVRPKETIELSATKVPPPSTMPPIPAAGHTTGG